ncbi:hypothetical protein [Pendulispora albinea]|uniref:Bacterial surface antigen (D15) domain-containing protein n=1 Tax=Pendulispora albinea TaxID=2741071 RepID=A0ABZ2LUB3_9BACT
MHRFFLFASLVLVLFGALSALPRAARAANDPNLVWKTITTPHFRISYYSGEEELAKRLADQAEAIHYRLSPVINWSPAEKVEVAIFDQTDSANGFTSIIPYNAIRLFVTAPDDLSPLSDYDDWFETLFTHEYTHTLHIDQIRGLPALGNALLGKRFSPNQVQPRWFIEGLAVYEESKRTSGGRLRSSQWQMFMRADVLENNVAPLDVFSNTPRRWPQGNIWYLYGSFFLKWIQEQYGEGVIREVIDDFGQQVIPLSVNRSLRRAIGKTYEDLYPQWIASLQRDFGAQRDAIRARGLREGVRLTYGGNSAQHPVWIPANSWPDHQGGLVYFRDDGHSTPGLYAIDLTRDPQGAVVSADDKGRELVVRTNGVAHASFAPDGTVVFESQAPFRRIFGFGDLFQLGAGEKSPSGIDGKRTRLTQGFRAADPSVSPDGRRVVFTTNHRGTRYVQIADRADDTVTHVRALVRSSSFEQAFAPEWSPDNRHVAYSVWTEGGYRDIRYVDTADGSYVEIAHDRAQEGGPSFSPDGRWLFFHSDRSGVSNVYAWNVQTHELKQVTNVVNGAYQPAVSPDGRTLAYLGYTHTGFDLFAMPLRESEWLDPLPYINDRPAPNPTPPHYEFPVTGYNPLETLRPRRFGVSITPGNFGQMAVVTADGADIAGHHLLAASMTTEFERPYLQFGLGYTYARLPVDLNMSVSRTITPRGGYQLGPNYKPTWIQEALGFSTGISYGLPSYTGFDGQSFALSYGVTRLGGDLPIPADKLDPYDTPVIPGGRGMMASVHLGWGYSNAQRFLYSIGAEKGFSISANFDFTNTAIASDFSGYGATLDFSTYFTMPWLQHHALALHAGTGTSGGNFGRAYSVGGMVDLPLYDVVRNVLIQGGVALRGYPPVAEAGRHYALFNAEYRFPIVNIDRGFSTFPVFFNRLTGAVFLDYGSAFDDATTAMFKTGVGGELWLDSLLAYILNFTFRIGYAKGLASGGLDKFYFVATVPF